MSRPTAEHRTAMMNEFNAAAASYETAEASVAAATNDLETKRQQLEAARDYLIVRRGHVETDLAASVP